MAQHHNLYTEPRRPSRSSSSEQGRIITTRSHTVSSPQPLSGPAGWFGRPVFLEARSPWERRALKRSDWWEGVDIPPGDGRPVLVIPGFFASRTGADELVHVLSRAGWDVEIATVGRNSGPAYTGVEACESDLARIHRRTGRKLTLIGHSRGGQFARVLAVRYPELVNQVVVMGTPLLVKYPPFAVVKVPAELLDRVWRRGLFGPVHPDREDTVDHDRYAPFPAGIDFVSIYSRTDGIVDWRTSIEPAAEIIEISASHVGLMSSIAGIRAVATALDRQGTPS